VEGDGGGVNGGFLSPFSKTPACRVFCSFTPLDMLDYYGNDETKRISNRFSRR
jgi:hypothetical protein